MGWETAMEFRQIRYALAVAKERSFTKAAARLNISQSAVSEQVKLLEGSISFSLFRRTGRGIEPTERGRMFLYEAERVLSDLMNLSDVARRLSGAGVETLVMGIGSGLAPVLLPHILPEGGLPAFAILVQMKSWGFEGSDYNWLAVAGLPEAAITARDLTPLITPA